MRHRSILFLLVLLCCVAVPALAASDQAPAFVRTAVTAPLEGREPLRVIFAPDEAACRKAYGDDWGVRCAAAPGQDGAVVSGVRLSPDIPGEWRWSGGDTMEFRPKNPWPESTAYTLSLAKLPLPSRMKLASPSLSFSTPPLAVLEMDGRLWIDPDLNGERAVSFDVRFTTQPDRQTVQRDAALKVSDKSLMLAKPEFVWGENGTCLIKSRILSLAKTSATVTLSLPGVAAEVRRDGTHWKIPKGKMEARQQVTAPGTSSLFRIKSASLETSRDASLAGEYRLTVETSLLVRPDAFAKAVTALQLPRALEEGAVEPTPWTKAPVVDETVLNRAKPAKIEPLQPADQPAGTLRFRVPVPSDSYLFLNLPQGFGTSPAFSLAGPWREVFHAAPFQPELDFLQPGNVLALGGERKLDLHASGLTAMGDSYLFESPYFSDPDSLTLHITKAEWLEKSQKFITVSLKTGEALEPMPGGMEISAIRLDDTTAQVAFLAPMPPASSETNLNFYQLGTGFYRTPDGTVKNTGGHSTYASDILWRNTPYETPIPEGYFVEEYTIEHCYWDVISMELFASRRTTFEVPVVLTLQ